MIKTTLLAFVAAALVIASSAFAGGKACCAKSASNKMACSGGYASLHLTADQKTKLDAWQAECMKAGCTKQSRSAFLKKAKGILSADQYAKLKTQCSQMDKKQA